MVDYVPALVACQPGMAALTIGPQPAQDRVMGMQSADQARVVSIGGAVLADESPHLSSDLRVLRRRAEKPSMWRRLDHVELGWDIGIPKCTVHPHRVRQEKITGACREERRAESLGEIAEEGGQVRFHQLVTIGIEQVGRHQ
jgi:hypothetical protein